MSAEKVKVAKLDPLLVETKDIGAIEFSISYFDLLQNKETLNRFIEVLKLYEDGYLEPHELENELKKIEKEIEDKKFFDNLKFKVGLIFLVAILFVIFILTFCKGGSKCMEYLL